MPDPHQPGNNTLSTPIDDLFAALFAPTTLPASPLPGSRPPPGSISTPSSATDSEFGAFVSVPASEDPLAQSPSSEAIPLGTPARHPLSASADFFAEARAATARNQLGVLEELLNHEDDPMYWHNKHELSPLSSAIPSGVTTPQQPPPQSTAAEDSAAVDILGVLAEPVKVAMQTITVAKPLLDALNEATSDSPFAPPPSQTESVSVTPRRPVPPSSSPIARSPSLPPSPSQLSPPILTRVESTSTFTPSSLPSRWMTSFLTYRGPPPSTIPPARIVPNRASISHGSPFAASPFVPASGAPGFDGDHTWNKGFDAGDGADSRDRRGVQLLGRKESTRAVLGTTLADAVRPAHFTRSIFSITDQEAGKKKKNAPNVVADQLYSHLPVRARLSRSWTLLFSLDQHGISLHTLYARCSAHTGGALFVVNDADDGCFGAWVADGIREGHGSYIGSGES
jgi:TLD